MAAKSWDADFRYPAIQASIRNLGDAHYDDPFRYPGSFCIPVAEKPMVGWTPGRVALIFLALGFLLFFAGVLLAGMVHRKDPGFNSPIVVAIAAACSLLGICMFFASAKFDRQIICWLLGERGRDLLERSEGSRTRTAEVSNPKTSNKITIDGDDHALIVFDEKNRRLMIEGIAARYQIRAADVEQLTTFQALNYVGVGITYRIDSETSLRVAIARVSMLYEVTRQIPILFFLRKYIPNKLFDNCVNTLQPAAARDSSA